jgi:hypothetical protein
MLFDDRLATVLRLRATGEAGLRTQYRQLLDLIGGRQQPLYPCEEIGEQSLIAAAWLRLDMLAEMLPARQRARIIEEGGWQLRNVEVVDHLAGQEPEIASAALSQANLTSAEWLALIPDLPVRARGFLRLRRDLPDDVTGLLDRLGVHDRGLPPPLEASSPEHERARPTQRPHLRAVETPMLAPDTDEAGQDGQGRSEIGALVQRIAKFRRDRSGNEAFGEHSPRLPLGEPPEHLQRPASSFGFAADAAGRIEWASSEVAPMVSGMRLTRPIAIATGDRVGDGRIARAFARRQPILRAPTTLAGAPAICGDWVVDAQPRFTEHGHFAGYFGRFRRPAEPAAQIDDTSRLEADRIRQLLHELRTPVTAVQGYAEVIQQQLFGPAPHEYRALAAAIAADAARILAGFEELDRLARLETGALAMSPGEVDLIDLVRRTSARLGQALGPRMAGIDLVDQCDTCLIVALDESDAEALIWRLLATLGGACSAGEILEARMVPVLQGGHAMASLRCELPAQLLAEENLFTSEAKPIGSAINAGLFGAGFALRLARAEAVAAGGRIYRDEDHLVLKLPLLTGTGTLQDKGADLSVV